MSREARIPPFRSADPEDFRKQAPQFAEFLGYAGGRLWGLINSEASYIPMAVYTHNDMPAVAALTQALEDFLGPVDERAESDPEAAVVAKNLRQAIGSMIRAVMEANGFRKTGRVRSVPPEPRRMFRRSEVYKKVLPDGPPDFDWDAFLGHASFAEVRRLSPELDGRRPPSIYDPDKRLYYSSSLDQAIECQEETDLRLSYEALLANWRHHAREPLLRPLQLHTLRVDITEVVGMLMKVVEDPEEFADFELKLVRHDTGQ